MAVYPAYQKHLRQSCHLITDNTEINMQRCQEVQGCCLTSRSKKIQAYAALADLTVKPGRNNTRLHTRTVFVNTTRQLGQKGTISCINIDTFAIKSFQTSCFFSFHLICFFLLHSASVIKKFIQYREMPESGKCNFSLTSVLTQESKSSPI